MVGRGFFSWCILLVFWMIRKMNWESRFWPTSIMEWHVGFWTLCAFFREITIDWCTWGWVKVRFLMCLLSQLFAASPISIHFLTTPMSHMSTHMVSEEETTLRRRIAAPRRMILGMAHGIGVYHGLPHYGPVWGQNTRCFVIWKRIFDA